MIPFLLGAGAFAALLWAAYALWAARLNREIAAGAVIEWRALQANQPALVRGYDEASFAEVYKRVHFPRFPGYALAAIAAFIVLSPLTLAGLAGFAEVARAAGLAPQPVALARYVPLGPSAQSPAGLCDADCQIVVAENFAGFYYFFGLLIAWVATVAVFMRRYHRTRPGYLREELVRSRPPQDAVQET